GLGAMALVARPWDEVGPWLAGRELWRAIDTSPRSCVVAGLPAEVDALVAELSGRKIFARRVDSEVPAHCPLLDVLRRDLLADVASVTPRAPALPLVTTTVAGEGAGEGAAFGPEHWVRNLCDAVLLRGAVAELVGRGFEAFVELSPHPLLTRPLEEGGAKVALATLRRDEDERGALLDAAGALYARGLPLRFEALDVAYGPAASPRGVPAARDRDAHVLALSARTPGSLAAQIERCAAWLGQESPLAADACFTLNAGRAHFAHRVAVVGRTAEELRGQLGMAAERARGAGPASAPKVAFVFTGQGAQYAGMGRALYATSPVFREAIDACDAELGGALGRPLPALLFGDD
ncbi:MAG TPA: acyltransferase domain-containing protein, partial [Polyangiaceae bacterium]|nr:acyltransferase domain-containing protein [Polyangiaceae bacterium]